MDRLALTDFSTLSTTSLTSKRTPGVPPTGGRVSGLICPTDANGLVAAHPSPISYRACAGDSPLGATGPFAPGKSVTLADIEEADGRAYTAGFSERLLGTAVDGRVDPVNYAVAGPLNDPTRCPVLSPSDWRGDAGGSWVESSWAFTIYNHATPINGASSCVSADKLSALIGASSAHAEGVNVLFLDGSVRTVRPTIALPIWKSLGTVGSRKPMVEAP